MTVLNAESKQQIIDRAEPFLRRVRSTVLVWSRGEEDLKGLFDAPDFLQELAEKAADNSMGRVPELALRLGASLSQLIGSGSPNPESDALPLLDSIAALEAEISEFRFGAEEFELDISSLLDESFDSIKSSEDASDESQLSEPSEAEEEEFEIDEEMLEIFAMEAEDHLKNINENLERLEQSPNDREALLEIRRSSHTLKGSAGIVGLKKLSKLAHKVEDLLDHLSENEIEGNADIFQLLLSATDCISAVANNDTSRDLEDKISRTFSDLEKMLESLTAVNGGDAEDQIEDEEVEDPEEKGAAFVPSGDSEVKAPAFQHQNGHSTRSVVRISLDKLDDLVKLVREMVFGRAVFQQRLSELEQQIKEMQNSTRRLQRSSGKLETDFAAGSPGSGPSQRHLGIHRSNGPVSDDDEFDSLEFDRYTDFNQLTRELLETTTDAFSITTELNVIRTSFESLYDTQKRLIDEIQDKLLSLRMIRFGTLAARLQRTVRMTASELDKIVDLSLEGETLEVDTHILDTLVEPLLHLLRNAVAHGIEKPETRRLLGKDEKGQIRLRVFSEGTHIILTVSDDGGGISSAALRQKALAAGLITERDAGRMSDEEALSLVFLPGLTTANEISQIAGRGVGMNIVKTNILRQQGTVSVSSEPQKGTTFTIRVPMALAIARALLVRVNERTFAFPLKLVKQITEVSAEDLQKARQEGSVTLGSGKHSVSYLNELLNVDVNPGTFDKDCQLLLLDTVKRKCALIVDEIIKPEEIVIKPLGHPLKDVPELLGATILGDGTVVPVLDLVQLLESRKSKPKPKKQVAEAKTESKKAEPRQTRVMIVDDSPSVRHVNSRLVKNNGWEPIVAKDGTEALEILSASANYPDVILTDVEMPEMDGYELLAILKQNDNLNHIPVVMITSRAGEKHRTKAFDLGVSEYLSKPYEDSQLVETIKKLSGKD
ncbi:MAG: hybrid sensor histidine kinase/response regulator [Acidobacteria bacterium]|nr:MAG: hybrid sensor histidine kinase/response regulator [Acidobacteriota bacterium]REK02427.1 MAG: hybrid sensor histidine kinase/response regulator [Acidobacteriota bacterium]REK13772.1 MAG: hybrid sensor histidine kinase/response regulator [Acidobacteriota bacterium]REK41766.1 MAG: hybrid sensor histidine kinase/response regulator [Acidobacteriota bacterium]